MNAYRPVTKEEFEAMAPGQQRVEIAKDVIAAVRAKQFIAQQGTYFKLLPGHITDDEWSADTSLQELMSREASECKVCAIGACFAALVTKVNEFDVEASEKIELDDFEMAEYLGKYFDDRQLRLMEVAFEGSDIHDIFETCVDGEGYVVTPEAEAAKKYSYRFEDPDELLIAIMENVIANDGEFKPEAVGE